MSSALYLTCIQGRFPLSATCWIAKFTYQEIEKGQNRFWPFIRRLSFAAHPEPALMKLRKNRNYHRNLKEQGLQGSLQTSTLRHSRFCTLGIELLGCLLPRWSVVQKPLHIHYICTHKSASLFTPLRFVPLRQQVGKYSTLFTYFQFVLLACVQGTLA